MATRFLQLPDLQPFDSLGPCVVAACYRVRGNADYCPPHRQTRNILRRTGRLEDEEELWHRTATAVVEPGRRQPQTERSGTSTHSTIFPVGGGKNPPSAHSASDQLQRHALEAPAPEPRRMEKRCSVEENGPNDPSRSPGAAHFSQDSTSVLFSPIHSFAASCSWPEPLF